MEHLIEVIKRDNQFFYKIAGKFYPAGNRKPSKQKVWRAYARVQSGRITPISDPKGTIEYSIG